MKMKLGHLILIALTLLTLTIGGSIAFYVWLTNRVLETVELIAQ